MPQLAGVVQPRRSNLKIEHALHAEVALRLAMLKPRCVYFSVPNGIYLPARTDQERALVARLVSQMKKSGQLAVGVADWIFLWDTGAGAIELKRPPQVSLLGKTPGGRLSNDQKTFLAWCRSLGVPYEVCDCWECVLEHLRRWGRV